MSAQPTGWSEAALGDVCRIVSGATPKTGVTKYWGGEIPWLTPNDMSRDRSQTLTGGERYLTELGYDSCSARLFPAGSVIVSSRAPVGYVAIAGREMCTNQGCKTAVPPDFIDSRYLYWYLLAAKPDLEARASGTTFKEISSKRFAETRLVWPDLAEQRRVVEILEDHLSRLDAASSATNRAVARTEVLRVASSAAEVSAASGSVIVPLSRHSLLVDYGTSMKAHPEPQASDVPVLRMGNVKHGRLDWSSLKYIPPDAPDLPRLLLRDGDLLFNRTNSAEHVGKSAVYLGREPTSFASYLIRVRFDEQVNPEWANLVINSPYGRGYIASVVSQQVGQANVNGTKLKAFPLVVPLLAEQEERLSRHSLLVNSADRLADGIRRVEGRGQGLRRAVLSAAFKGKLTGRHADDDVMEEAASLEGATR